MEDAEIGVDIGEGAAPAQFHSVRLDRLEIGTAKIEFRRGVAYLQADIGQLESLAIRSVELMLVDGVEDHAGVVGPGTIRYRAPRHRARISNMRSEEHTSELQSLMRIS